MTTVWNFDGSPSLRRRSGREIIHHPGISHIVRRSGLRYRPGHESGVPGKQNKKKLFKKCFMKGALCLQFINTVFVAAFCDNNTFVNQLFQKLLHAGAFNTQKLTNIGVFCRYMVSQIGDNLILLLRFFIVTFLSSPFYRHFLPKSVIAELL